MKANVTLCATGAEPWSQRSKIETRTTLLQLFNYQSLVWHFLIKFLYYQKNSRDYRNHNYLHIKLKSNTDFVFSFSSTLFLKEFCIFFYCFIYLPYIVIFNLTMGCCVSIQNMVCMCNIDTGKCVLEYAMQMWPWKLDFFVYRADWIAVSCIVFPPYSGLKLSWVILLFSQLTKE